MRNTRTSYKPTSLLPAVYPKNEHALDIANAKRIEQLRLEMQTIKTLANPRTCPVAFLSLLAYSVGSDFYWELKDLNEAEQREMIANSLQLHRRKGTRWAVEKVLSVLGVETEITEWWEENEQLEAFEIKPTKPYTFAVIFDVVSFYKQSERILSENEQRRLLKYLNIYKNVRSHFDMHLKLNSENNVFLPMMANTTKIDIEILKSKDYRSDSKTEMSTVASVQKNHIQVENLEFKNPTREVVNEMEIAMSINITEVYDG